MKRDGVEWFLATDCWSSGNGKRRPAVGGGWNGIGAVGAPVDHARRSQTKGRACFPACLSLLLVPWPNKKKGWIGSSLGRARRLLRPASTGGINTAQTKKRKGPGRRPPPSIKESAPFPPSNLLLAAARRPPLSPRNDHPTAGRRHHLCVGAVGRSVERAAWGAGLHTAHMEHTHRAKEEMKEGKLAKAWAMRALTLGSADASPNTRATPLACLPCLMCAACGIYSMDGACRGR